MKKHIKYPSGWATLYNTYQLLQTIPRLIKTIYIQGLATHVIITSQYLKSIALLLKKATLLNYQQLIDIVTYDRPGKFLRFTLLYNLLTLHYNNRLLLTLQTSEVNAIPSISQLYPSSGWLEREVWDMFGIFFSDHFDLRRILTDYGFTGFPLRKDFPLTGFTETFYNEEQKRVVYQPVELSQETRHFTYQRSW